MKGIIDTQALNIYKDDFKECFNTVIEPESPELNIDFLEYRHKVLNDQATTLSKKRDAIKAELESTMAKLGGELFTINQLLKYTLKEEGACELKIYELKEELSKFSEANTLINK